jgi:hypothetical protein
VRVSRATGAPVDTHVGDGGTGATFVDLRIAGVELPSSPAPNTVVALPGGIGSVTLNAQTTVAPFFGEPAKVAVDAIKVTLIDLAGIAGDVSIGHAEAGLGTTGGRLGASGYLLNASAAPVASVGPIGGFGMGCAGTDGADRTRDQVGVSVPGVGSVGAGRITVNALVKGATATSRATATAGAIDLLDGLVTADALTARAVATAGPEGARSEATGSEVAHLVIAGRAFEGTVAPNTRVELPGIGHVIVNERGCSSDRPGQAGSCAADHRTQVQVTSLRIRVTAANDLGLPLGADIVVNRAVAGAST